MDSTARAQKDGWWKRAWEYVRKHREMTRSGSGRMVWISSPDGGNHDAAGPMVQQERLEPKESATNAVTAQVEPDHNQQARR